MTDYSKLQALLELRLKVIADSNLRENNPEEQLRQLQNVSEDITHCTNEAKGIPQQLNHFLKQSSLNKALDFVKEINS